MQLRAHVCVHLYLYVYLHVCMNTCMFAFMLTAVLACMVTRVHACVYNCADIRACKVAQVAQGGSSSGGFRGAQGAPESKEVAQREIYGEPKGTLNQEFQRVAKLAPGEHKNRTPIDRPCSICSCGDVNTIDKHAHAFPNNPC